MIISGGENIYPREVEDVVAHCPGVREVSVIGVPDPKWGQVVTACVIPSAPDLTAEAIMDHFTATGALANFKKPRRIHLMDSFPMNPSGKVLRGALLDKVTEKETA